MWLILSLIASVGTFAIDSLQGRLLALDIRPERLFYAPHTPEEWRFHEIGVSHFSQRCERTFERGHLSTLFKGYIPLADPYHPGLRKISFLMGSDCSRFVHRLYQLLGAEYPFAKTRHLIQRVRFKESGETPDEYYAACARGDCALDLPRVRWRRLVQAFEVLESLRRSEVGDLWVSESGLGEFGPNGHVVIVSRRGDDGELWVLHAKNSVSGIVEERADLYLERFPQTWALRFREELKFRSLDRGLPGLLSLEWPENVR